MGRRVVTNGLLAVLVVGLGLLAWLSLRQDAAGPDHKPLLSFSAAAVQTIRIRTGDRPEFRLTRGTGGWRLERPYDLPADEARVDRLLAIAATPTSAEADLTGRDPAEFGLAPPQAELFLNDARITIGGEHPLEGRRFVAVGERLNVINDRFLPLVLAPPEAFIYRAPLQGIDPAAIEAPAWGIERGPNGAWRWMPDRRGSGQPAALAQAWQAALAERVEPAPPSAGTDAQQIRIQPADGTPQRTFALIGDGDAWLLVREDKGVAYRMAAEVAGRLGLLVPAK